MAFSDPNAPNLPEELLSRFQIEQRVGTGGTGTVYKAFDRSLKRAIAIKVLNADKFSPQHIARLHKEARAICQLKHNNIVQVYDFILCDETPALVMEYVDGTPLDEIIKQSGPPPLKDSLALFMGICAAMSYAHRHGVLHRDLGPNNVLVCTTGDGMDIKVVDFGLARIETHDDKTLGGGAFKGTATVISPEQARGLKTDERSDVYSLGCLMYKTMTGKFPFLGESLLEIVSKQINEPAPTLAEGNPDLLYPPDLERVVEVALEKAPADRFQNMEDMRLALEQVALKLDSEDSHEDEVETVLIAQKRRLSIGLMWAAGLAILISAGAGVAYLLLQSEPEPERRRSDVILFKKNTQRWLAANKVITPELFETLRREEDIRRVSLRHVKVSTKDLSELCNFPLEILDLRNTGAGDSALKIIGGKCPSLKTLLVSGNLISDAGLRELDGLANLGMLSLRDTSITDDGVIALCKQHPNLRLVQLYGCKGVTERSIPSLLSLKMVDFIDVGKTSIAKSKVKPLFQKDRLGFISVAHMNLEDSDLPDELNPGLARLFIPGNNFTGAIFEKLAKLPHLWYLDLSECPRIRYPEMRTFEKAHEDRPLILIPVCTTYDNTMDLECYFEPELYRKSKAKPKEMQILMEKWHTERAINNTFQEYADSESKL